MLLLLLGIRCSPIAQMLLLLQLPLMMHRGSHSGCLLLMMMRSDMMVILRSSRYGIRRGALQTEGERLEPYN